LKRTSKVVTSVKRQDKPKKKSSTFASLLPQCSEPNQKINMNLFGPLKTMPLGKMLILYVMNAVSKSVELVVIPDKSALTVCSALFLR
jgi:hypothetical protein